MNIFHNDAYQLSMLYAHWKNGRASTLATAEAFFRRYPHTRYPGGTEDIDTVIMAGAYRLNEMLNSSEFRDPFSYDDMAYIQNHVLRVSDDEFEPFETYLRETFPQELASLEVSYVRDGEILYWDFPTVQVTGPIGAVHMLETPILSILNSSVRAATLARKIRNVAGEMKLIDFSTRRQDEAAAVHTAVAAVIGGFDATSNLEAGRVYHVPVSGTMAHAYVLSYGMQGELRAFKEFIRTYPETHVLLVDTFDIMAGVANAMRASFETQIPLKAVRLDSGVWTETLPAVRRLLDMMGFTETKIIVSGDFAEPLIRELRIAGVLPLVDGIGIGSRLASPDFSMGFVYKLVEVDGCPVMKMSGAKSSLPGRKMWLKNSDPPIGNLLVLHGGPWTPPSSNSDHNTGILDERAERVLQADEGLVPVGVDYVRKARALTSLRMSQNEGCFWDKSEVERAADSLRAGLREKDLPYRDDVVLLTTNTSSETMDRIKRETAELSKAAVRQALGKPNV